MQVGRQKKVGGQREPREKALLQGKIGFGVRKNAVFL